MSKPLAYAIAFDKSEEELLFFKTHEGTHLITYTSPSGTHLEFDGILQEIRDHTSPVVIFGKTLSGKRLLWNDSYPGSRPHWNFLCNFIRRCIEAATGTTHFDLEYTNSADETIEKIKNNVGPPYDLILTQYGLETTEAHSVLREIKQMQLEEMEAYRPGCAEILSETDTPLSGKKRIRTRVKRYLNLPAVIVCGMSSQFDVRKNQLTRLGALDYCGWPADFCLQTLNNADLCFLGTLFRAFSRFQNDNSYR